MTVEAAIVELTTRIDDLEADLGRRVAVLERLVSASPRADRSTEPSITAPQVQVPSATIAAPPPPPPRATAAAQPGMAPPPPGSPGSPLPPPPVAADAVPSGPPVQAPSNAGSMAGAMTPLGLEDVLRIAGVLLVGLAAVFLVSTAISRGWIGPELQLLGATMIGFSMFGGAVYLVEKRRAWATTFAIGGSAVVTTCAGAAYAWLELFGPVPALILVGAATAIAVAVAIRIRAEVVGIAATVAMLIVPPFASIVADGPVLATGIWLGLFAVVAMAVGLTQQWSLYRLLSTWATAFWVIVLAAGLAIDNNTDHLVAGSALVTVVGLVLWLGPVFSERLVRASAIGGFGATSGQTQLLALEHRVVAAIPIWAWLSVSAFGGYEESTGAILGLVMAAGFVLVAVVARAAKGWISEIGFLSHLLGAGLLVTVSLLSWLDGPVLVVGLAAQGVITLVLAYYFNDLLLKLNGVFLAGLAWLLVMVDMVDVVQLAVDQGDRAAVGDHIARGVAVLFVGVSAWLVARNEDGETVEAATGAAWLAALLFPVSLLSPFVDDRLWLVVTSVAALISLVASFRLGRLVLAIGAVIGGLTVMAAAVGMIGATAEGLDGGEVAVIDHVAHAFVVLSLGFVTAGLWSRRSSELSSSLFVATWVMALGWFASVLVAVPQGQVAISALWAFAACGAIVAGLRTARPEVRYVGFATLGVVLVKLLTVDLAEVDTFWRVGLFLVIGLGLLRLGYVLPSLAARYSTPEDEAATQTGPEAGPDGQAT